MPPFGPPFKDGALFQPGHDFAEFLRTKGLFIIWFQVRLTTEVLRTPSSIPDHDSALHVTETPALTTWPSMTSRHAYE